MERRPTGEIATHSDASPSEAVRTPVNIAQVRHLSPFRYPGGKTWCVPNVRAWLASIDRPKVFIEPFAGGAIVGLTVAVEKLADRVVLVEIDNDVASVWQITFGKSDTDFEWLIKKIASFNVNRNTVDSELARKPKSTRERAFRTIVRNRVNRGGILAPGASVIKVGENGKGLRSRWYPETLIERLRTIRAAKSRISYFQDDAFKVMTRYRDNRNAAFFIDPPYTAGGKNAGSRLYVHNKIDHRRLFGLLEECRGEFLATYDDAKDVRDLARLHGFVVDTIPMKSTHHAVVEELLITRA